jgi:hypothetical protein
MVVTMVVMLVDVKVEKSGRRTADLMAGTMVASMAAKMDDQLAVYLENYSVVELVELMVEKWVDAKAAKLDLKMVVMTVEMRVL